MKNMGQKKIEQTKLVKTQTELKTVLAKIKKSYSSKKIRIKRF